MSKLVRLFNTVKYLKKEQIVYRLYYLLRNKIRKKIGFSYRFSKPSFSKNLTFQPIISSYESFDNNKFSFLNLSKSFDGQIDWNFNEFGKLWTYNLNYFDYLHQQNISNQNALNLIHNYIESMDHIKDGLEPYPISLRVINWVKFLSLNDVKDQRIDDSLYAQLYILKDNLEFHLLGNHLLENAFALLFGAYYFEDENLYKKAKKLLIEELTEQILEDGAHFELSPMYHQIIFHRLLDALNLVQNCTWKEKELAFFLKKIAEKMLSWLRHITYQNGQIPCVNDTTFNIAAISDDLFHYAKLLDIESELLPLSTSGYRKIHKKHYEFLFDIGSIGPDYIPGHAHADTFNFELYIDKKPFIVDRGISTYEKNQKREEERGTLSHNTVCVEKRDSSDVWGGFRVAKRAKVIKVHESENRFEVVHNGYKNLNVEHKRVVELNEKSINIKDILSQDTHAISSLHFHPSVSKEEIFKHFQSDYDFSFKTYSYCLGFNSYQDAIKIEIPFTKNLEIKINI